MYRPSPLTSLCTGNYTIYSIGQVRHLTLISELRTDIRCVKDTQKSAAEHLSRDSMLTSTSVPLDATATAELCDPQTGSLASLDRGLCTYEFCFSRLLFPSDPTSQQAPRDFLLQLFLCEAFLREFHYFRYSSIRATRQIIAALRLHTDIARWTRACQP